MEDAMMSGIDSDVMAFPEPKVIDPEMQEANAKYHETVAESLAKGRESPIGKLGEEIIHTAEHLTPEDAKHAAGTELFPHSFDLWPVDYIPDFSTPAY
jgi:hypothetical protein